MTMQGRIATLGTLAVGTALGARMLRRRLSPFDFAGRAVLITGGSRGLGLVLARELANAGARLTLLARDQDELERAARDLAARGAEVLALPCDVRRQDEARAAIERAVEHYGRLDVLINNAGVIQVGPLDHMSVADFHDAMAVHTWGPLYTMLAALPQLRRQGGGRIVNIASIGGKLAVPHLAPYSVSKFALVGLSDAMRAELARDGIMVTTVCPGLMRTGSHVNALFKGRHRAEYALFSISDALPMTSINARRAARQIMASCRRGDPELTITVQARLVVLWSALFPAAVARALALIGGLLPPPDPGHGERAWTGWQSQSPLAPSALTYLADKAVPANNEEPAPTRS